MNPIQIFFLGVCACVAILLLIGIGCWIHQDMEAEKAWKEMEEREKAEKLARDEALMKKYHQK